MRKRKHKPVLELHDILAEKLSNNCPAMIEISKNVNHSSMDIERNNT